MYVATLRITFSLPLEHRVPGYANDRVAPTSSQSCDRWAGASALSGQQHITQIHLLKRRSRLPTSIGNNVCHRDPGWKAQDKLESQLYNLGAGKPSFQ